MEIRIAAETDLPVICRLFEKNDAVDENLPREDFLKVHHSQFFRNSPGAHYQLVGFDQDNLVCHTGMVPFYYHVKKQQLVGGLGAKLVVDESQRGSFAFFSLKRTYLRGYQKKAGIDFTYGLINKPKVLDAHLKVGYQKIGDIRVYARPLKASVMARAMISNKILRILAAPLLVVVDGILRFSWTRTPKRTVETIEEFDERFIPLLDDFAGKFEISAVRNLQTLRWRFRDLPHRNYRILAAKEGDRIRGFAVMRPMAMKEFRSLALTDLVCDPEDKKTMRALLKAVHRAALEEGADLISTVLNPHSPFLKDMKRFGYIKTPEAFTLVTNTPRKSEISFDQSDYEKWHISWFDHDVV